MIGAIVCGFFGIAIGEYFAARRYESILVYLITEDDKIQEAWLKYLAKKMIDKSRKVNQPE